MRGSVYGAEDVQASRDLGYHVIASEELRSLGLSEYGRVVLERVGDRPVFLSFNIDFLDPAFAPGTGTPEVAGFSTAEALALLRALRGIRLAGADVVEVSPSYDSPGNSDGARLTALLRSGLPERTVRGEIIALLLAFVDEPPRAREAVWYLLGRHLEADARLHRELDASRASPYLEAVLLEALRLFPLARYVDRCPIRDVRIGAFEVRRGRTSRQLAGDACGRAVSEHPSLFEPERWLDARPGGRASNTVVGALTWPLRRRYGY